MEINYKKIGLIIGFVAIVILLGFSMYFIFFKNSIVPTTNDEINNGSSSAKLPDTQINGSGPINTGTGVNKGLPNTDAQTGNEAGLVDQTRKPNTVANDGLTKITALNNVNSFAPTLSTDGNKILYYNKDDGKFYRINNNGQTELLSNKTFFNVQNVTWSPDKQKAVLEYPDGSNIVYDFAEKKQYSLPKHWKDFSFSPQSDKIVAKSIGTDPSNRWLMVANEDGSHAQSIEPLGDKDATVHTSWSPNNLSVALYTESLDFDRQKLYFVGLNKENFKATTIEGRGFEHLWDEQGNKLLYSVYSSTTQLKPSLWIVNAKADSIGDNRQNLNLQTWAHKCTFADSTIVYCAVPNELPEGAGLFPELAQNSVDSLYKINITNGSQTLVAIPDGNYNINNIIVAADESNLYFTDIFTGKLYTINLK